MSVKETIYLDSAASSHMMNKLEWLEEYEELKGASVKAGNGARLDIKEKGSLSLSISMENGAVEYEVMNILYVLELSDILISIREITREGHKVTFQGNSVKVQFEGGKSFEVECSQGMYPLTTMPRTIDKQALVARTDSIDKAKLWHYCLGHLRCNITR